jgi:hypothetical protein
LVSSFFVVCCPLGVLGEGPVRLKKEREENERKEDESSAFLGLCEFPSGGWVCRLGFNPRFLNERN